MKFEAEAVTEPSADPAEAAEATDRRPPSRLAGAGGWTWLDALIAVGLVGLAAVPRYALPGDGFFYDDAWQATAAVRGGPADLATLGQTQPGYALLQMAERAAVRIGRPRPGRAGFDRGLPSGRPRCTSSYGGCGALGRSRLAARRRAARQPHPHGVLRPGEDLHHRHPDRAGRGRPRRSPRGTAMDHSHRGRVGTRLGGDGRLQLLRPHPHGLCRRHPRARRPWRPGGADGERRRAGGGEPRPARRRAGLGQRQGGRRVVRRPGRHDRSRRPCGGCRGGS